MHHNVIAAAIIAFGLIVAAFMLGGRYTMVRTNDFGIVRLDRWTGTASICAEFQDDTSGCIVLADRGASQSNPKAE